MKKISVILLLLLSITGCMQNKNKNCNELEEFYKDQNHTYFKSCLDNEMIELIANTTEAATEKHIPVIEINGDIATVTVGETLHPMTEEHFIPWIYLETNKGIRRKNLKPNDEPKCEFKLLKDEKVTSAYAYCNLHSLWKKEL